MGQQAQKQPSIKDRVVAHPSSLLASKMNENEIDNRNIRILKKIGNRAILYLGLFGKTGSFNIILEYAGMSSLKWDYA